jgi:hypothetical protein
VIIGYTGTLGGGKTLRAVMDAWNYSLAAGGAPVWGNLTLRPEGWVQHRALNPDGFKLGFIATVDDIVRMIAEGGGILILDEIHQDLDSRQSLNSQNIFLSRFLMFLRKAGITTLYTTQDDSQIDKRVRGVTDILTWCEGFGPREARTHRYTRMHYRSGRQLRVELVTSDQAKRYYGLYDTYQFTRQLEFPSKIADFEAFMVGIEEASRFARSYRGDPHRAWEAFLAESGYSPKSAGGRRKAVSPGGRVRAGAGRTPGGRRRSAAVTGDELEAEA